MNATEFNETEIAYALWTLQRDRNQGIPLDAARAEHYRRQAARRVEIAEMMGVPSHRAGFGQLCAAQMIESEAKNTKSAA